MTKLIRFVLGIIMTAVITVNVENSSAAYVNNPMTEALDGDGYDIYDITELEAVTITATDVITKGPRVDVRAFGAIGNGTTDDTTAIKAAISYAAGSSGDEKKTVYFPPGAYLISDTLVVPAVVPLVGEGQSISGNGPQSKILVAGGTNKNAIEMTGAAIRLENISVQFSANNTSGSAIYITSPTSGIIRNVRTYCSPEYGLKIENGWGLRVYYGFFDGVYVNNNAYLKLHGCVSEKDGDVCLRITGTSNLCNISDSHFEGTNLSGTDYVIHDNSSGSNVYSGNTVSAGVSGTLDAVIYIDGAPYVKIIGNSITSTGTGRSIVLKHSSTWGWAQIIGNNIKGPIYMDQSSNTDKHIIMGNRILDSTEVYITLKNKNNIVCKNIYQSGIYNTPVLVKEITGATPSVGGFEAFKTNNASAVTMTGFSDGQLGQCISVIFGDSNTTVDFTGTSLKGNGGTDWNPGQNDSMICVYDGTNWYCTVSDN